MSRWLLVEIEGGLDHSRHEGIFYACKLVPGVRSVTLLEAIDRETLDLMLLQPEPTPSPVLHERALQLEFMA